MNEHELTHPTAITNPRLVQNALGHFSKSEPYYRDNEYRKYLEDARERIALSLERIISSPNPEGKRAQGRHDRNIAHAKIRQAIISFAIEQFKTSQITDSTRLAAICGQAKRPLRFIQIILEGNPFDSIPPSVVISLQSHHQSVFKDISHDELKVALGDSVRRVSRIRGHNAVALRSNRVTQINEIPTQNPAIDDSIIPLVPFFYRISRDGKITWTEDPFPQVVRDIRVRPSVDLYEEVKSEFIHRISSRPTLPKLPNGYEYYTDLLIDIFEGIGSRDKFIDFLNRHLLEWCYITLRDPVGRARVGLQEELQARQDSCGELTATLRLISVLARYDPESYQEVRASAGLLFVHCLRLPKEGLRSEAEKDLSTLPKGFQDLFQINGQDPHGVLVAAISRTLSDRRVSDAYSASVPLTALRQRYVTGAGDLQRSDPKRFDEQCNDGIQYINSILYNFGVNEDQIRRALLEVGRQKWIESFNGYLVNEQQQNKQQQPPMLIFNQEFKDGRQLIITLCLELGIPTPSITNGWLTAAYDDRVGFCVGVHDSTQDGKRVHNYRIADWNRKRLPFIDDQLSKIPGGEPRLIRGQTVAAYELTKLILGCVCDIEFATVDRNIQRPKGQARGATTAILAYRGKDASPETLPPSVRGEKIKVVISRDGLQRKNPYVVIQDQDSKAVMKVTYGVGPDGYLKYQSQWLNGYGRWQETEGDSTSGVKRKFLNDLIAGVCGYGLEIPTLDQLLKITTQESKFGGSSRVVNFAGRHTVEVEYPFDYFQIGVVKRNIGLWSPGADQIMAPPYLMFRVTEEKKLVKVDLAEHWEEARLDEGPFATTVIRYLQSQNDAGRRLENLIFASPELVFYYLLKTKLRVDDWIHRSSSPTDIDKRYQELVDITRQMYQRERAQDWAYVLKTMQEIAGADRQKKKEAQNHLQTLFKADPVNLRKTITAVLATEHPRTKKSLEGFLESVDPRLYSG